MDGNYMYNNSCICTLKIFTAYKVYPNKKENNIVLPTTCMKLMM